MKKVTAFIAGLLIGFGLYSAFVAIALHRHGAAPIAEQTEAK